MNKHGRNVPKAVDSGGGTSGSENSTTCQYPAQTSVQKRNSGRGRRTRKMKTVTRISNTRASSRRSEQCGSVVDGVKRKEEGKIDGKGVEVIPFAVEDR
jgi:hypothetical protein